MREAEYYLRNLKQWKTTVLLLKETRNELTNFVKGVSFSTEDMPGISHKPIIDKFNKAIDDRERYQYVIDVYNFYINRIENAMMKLLTPEERKICLIYASYYNRRGTREMEIIKNGYSLAAFYREKSRCIEILEFALNEGATFPKHGVDYE